MSILRIEKGPRLTDMRRWSESPCDWAVILNQGPMQQNERSESHIEVGSELEMNSIFRNESESVAE